MVASVGIVYLFSVIPVVLVVSSAVLLDHAIRYEKLLHRCQIQIWMWLALSLTMSIRWPEPNGSGNNNDGAKQNSGGGGNQQIVGFVWAHLALFFNLLAIIADALQSHLVAPSRWKQHVRITLQIMPISAWWSMSVAVACTVVPAYTTTSESTMPIDSLWKLSLWTFLAVFLVIWLIRNSANRRRKNSIDMQGMPTTMTTTATASSSDRINGGGIMARLCGMGPIPATVDYGQLNTTQCWFDERQWYTWTRIQTILWFAQQLSSKADNGIYEEEKDMVVSILAKHRITGEVLDGLADLSQLVALRVPFGPACRLSDSIAGLIERYPKPRIINGTRQRTRRVANGLPTSSNHSELRASNDCLDLHDYEYNTERSFRQMNEQPVGVNDGLRQEHPNSSHVPVHQHGYQDQSSFEGGVSEEQQEKLNNAMKERFGLELPKLKATDWLAVRKGLSNKANNDHEISNDQMPHPHPFTVTTAGGSVDPALSNNYSNTTTTIPLAQTLRQDPPSLSSSIDNRTIPPSLSPKSTREQILEGMPPELREIAKRRPDLVETIWKQKQQQMLQQQRKSSNFPPSTAVPPKRFNGLPATPEITREDSMLGGNRMDAVDEEYDSEDEDERTSLIHRDSSNDFPGRYKSIDKSMIPSLI